VCRSVAYATAKSLTAIKGISDTKATKLLAEAAKLVPMGFTTATEYHKQRQEIIHLTTGSKVCASASALSLPIACSQSRFDVLRSWISCWRAASKPVRSPKSSANSVPAKPNSATRCASPVRCVSACSHLRSCASLILHFAVFFFCFQLKLEQGGGEGKALYIDTEGTFRPKRLIAMAEK
jgi:hypothetical protein